MLAELLTPQEAAEFLKVPVSFIYDRTRQNAIPVRRIGKYVRIPRAELESWVNGVANSGTQKSTPDLDCGQAEGLNTLPDAEDEERKAKSE